MADVKISELTAQASANVDVSADVLALVDTSATQTKKISVENLLSPITINKSAGTITSLGTVTGNVDFNGDLDVAGSVASASLTTTGNIGVGSTTTTSPSSASRTLRIQHDTGSAGLVLCGDNNNESAWDILANVDGALEIRKNNYPQLNMVGGTGVRIESGGSGATAGSPGAMLHVAHSSSTAYNGGAEILESAIIQNTNGSDGSGVNNVASLGLQVASGATSQAFINYVRTGDNTGDFTISQRTGSSSYAEHMRITSSGKLGVGTTFGENIASSVSKFAVRSDTGSSHYNMVNIWEHDNNTAGIEQRIGWAFGDDGGSEASFGFAGYVGIGKEDSWHVDSGRDSYMTFAVAQNNSVSEAMRITSAGKVGIGLTDPGHLLDVTAADGASDNNAVARFVNSESTPNRSKGVYIRAGSTDDDWPLQIDNYDASATLIRILGSGSVCIARTSALSPKAKLVVASALDGGTTPAASFQANTSTSSGACVVFHSGDGSEAGSVALSNANAADSVTYNTSSDYRLKEKVKTLPNGLDRVNQMKPVEYEWKKSKSKSEGFLAHELQEICDYAVTGEKDGDRMQQIDYSRITPILVKAIQELSAKVEVLENA